MPTSEGIFYIREEKFYKMIYYLPFKYVTRKYEFKNGRIIVTEKTLNNKENKIKTCRWLKPKKISKTCCRKISTSTPLQSSAKTNGRSPPILCPLLSQPVSGD
jgi:hypothetical protein